MPNNKNIKWNIDADLSVPNMQYQNNNTFQTENLSTPHNKQAQFAYPK